MIINTVASGGFLHLLFLLIFGHALADYPLQGEFLAKAKNRFAPLPGVPWSQALTSHAIIHGGMVVLITNNFWLGAAEAVAHGVIDDTKCRGRLSFHQDQALHLLCKIIWAAIAVNVSGL